MDVRRDRPVVVAVKAGRTIGWSLDRQVELSANSTFLRTRMERRFTFTTDSGSVSLDSNPSLAASLNLSKWQEKEEARILPGLLTGTDRSLQPCLTGLGMLLVDLDRE